MSFRDGDEVLVALDVVAAELLLARLGWTVDTWSNVARDPFSDDVYRLTSPGELAKAIRIAVKDLRGARA